jgi:hypothetical protein
MRLHRTLCIGATISPILRASTGKLFAMGRAQRVGALFRRSRFVRRTVLGIARAASRRAALVQHAAATSISRPATAATAAAAPDQGLTLVHFSAQRHTLFVEYVGGWWHQFGCVSLSLPNTAKVELKSGRVVASVRQCASQSVVIPDLGYRV